MTSNLIHPITTFVADDMSLCPAYLGNHAIGNSLPQEIAADKCEPLARSVSVHVKTWSQLQGHKVRLIVRWLAIDQESVAMLLGARWSKRLVYRIGDWLLVLDAARLRVVSGG